MVFLPNFSLLVVPYSLRTLAIIMAIFTLSAACLNSSKDDIPNHWRRFWSHEFLLLPGPLLPSTFPCRMSCNSRYLLFLIICPKYSIFLLFTVNVTSFVLSILLSTSLLVVCSIHEMRNILRYQSINQSKMLYCSKICTSRKPKALNLSTNLQYKKKQTNLS